MTDLKHTAGNVLVMVDPDEKNSHDLGGGIKLILSRGRDNFNRRQTQPVQGVAVSGDGVPKGAVLLLHHNSVHDAYIVTAVKPVDGKQLYSVPVTQCYAILHDDTIEPLPGFFLALRVFKKPAGKIITDLQACKNKLFVVKGKHERKVVDTLVYCDYEIRFQWKGREAGIIRARDEEVIALDVAATEAVEKGGMLTGLDVLDASDKFKLPCKKN